MFRPQLTFTLPIAPYGGDRCRLPLDPFASPRCSSLHPTPVSIFSSAVLNPDDPDGQWSRLLLFIGDLVLGD
jgi:hypothetical protein